MQPQPPRPICGVAQTLTSARAPWTVCAQTTRSAQTVCHSASWATLSAEDCGRVEDVVDLPADGFRPGMSRGDVVAWRQAGVVDPLVEDYQRRLFEADHLVFLFPI